MDNVSVARLQSLMQALFSQDLSWHWKGVFAAWAQLLVTQKETKCPLNLDWLIFSGFRLSWWLSLIISFFSFRFNQRLIKDRNSNNQELNEKQTVCRMLLLILTRKETAWCQQRWIQECPTSFHFLCPLNIGHNSSPSQIKYSPFPICAQLYTSRVWDKLLIVHPKKKTFSRSIHFSVLLEKTQARQKCRCLLMGIWWRSDFNNIHHNHRQQHHPHHNPDMMKIRLQ